MMQSDDWRKRKGENETQVKYRKWKSLINSSWEKENRKTALGWDQKRISAHRPRKNSIEMYRKKKSSSSNNDFMFAQIDKRNRVNTTENRMRLDGNVCENEKFYFKTIPNLIQRFLFVHTQSYFSVFSLLLTCFFPRQNCSIRFENVSPEVSPSLIILKWSFTKCLLLLSSEQSNVV